MTSEQRSIDDILATGAAWITEDELDALEARITQLEVLLREAQELIWQLSRNEELQFELLDRIDAALAEPTPNAAPPAPDGCCHRAPCERTACPLSLAANFPVAHEQT